MNFPRVQRSLSSTYSLAQRFALGVFLLVGAGGCQPATTEESEDALGVASEELRVANSLTTKALVLNAMTTNPDAIPQLVGQGLVPLFAPGAGSPYLQQQLRDPDARQVMSYLVGCALPAGTSVPWTNPATGGVEQWEGKLGLCPSWKDEAPSPTCLNWVSACLLARNNALGRRVELSLRGEDPTRPTLFSLESAARPVAFDPATDAPVPSLAACTTEQAGAARDCGWKAEFIGQCTPGQWVRLGAGGRAPDQCTTGAVLGGAAGARMVLRVCNDIHGCDQGSPRLLAQNEGTCATTAPAVKFACPSSGFFSVQSAPYDSGQLGSVAVAAETGTPAATTYPTNEARTFFLREGAYYGNIFEPKALAAEVYVDRDGKVQGKEQVVKGAVYRKMYACQAPGWSTAQAYATHRLCALPGQDANCAATSTGTCVDPKDPRYPSSRCRLDDGPLVKGDGDYEQCLDSLGTKWMEPITVFLHDACGVVREGCGTK